MSKTKEITEISWKDHIQTPYRTDWIVIGSTSLVLGLCYLGYFYTPLLVIGAVVAIYSALFLSVAILTPKAIRGALNPWLMTIYFVFLFSLISITWQTLVFYNFI